MKGLDEDENASEPEILHDDGENVIPENNLDIKSIQTS